MIQDFALVVVDVQKGFADPYWGRRNNPHAEKNISQLLTHWRESQGKVVVVKHNSTNPCSPLYAGTPGNALCEEVRPLPGELLIEKCVNSSFIGTDLETYLRSVGKGAVIVGLTTPHCISTTARMSQNLGFPTVVVEDATAAFEIKSHDGRIVAPEDVHYHALASISSEFAQIRSTQQLLTEKRRLAAS